MENLLARLNEEGIYDNVPTFEKLCGEISSLNEVWQKIAQYGYYVWWNGKILFVRNASDNEIYCEVAFTFTNEKTLRFYYMDFLSECKPYISDGFYALIDGEFKQFGSLIMPNDDGINKIDDYIEMVRANCQKLGFTSLGRK